MIYRQIYNDLLEHLAKKHVTEITDMRPENSHLRLLQ
jgi:hypothetical protein